MTIRIVVADDHPLVHAAISRRLRALEGVEIVGTAQNAGDLIALLETTPCDVVVTDYAMPNEDKQADGLPLLGEIAKRFPQARIVLLTGIDNAELLRTIEARGIVRIVSKADDASDIDMAIKAALEGAPYRSASIARLIASGMLASADRPSAHLTPREVEVVRLLAEGLTATEIAKLTGRSHKTTSAQKVSAKRKLGFEQDADLFLYAVTSGMVAASGAARTRSHDDENE
ncbi:LuxR family two component transcriptional regulator [Luteibacter rhizovicinus]|uniref:LuxR family two component transcriptional regulator n=1 Tax=Luteibacter rhizovicinus TaxID=242606 RepID=A0A4R3YKQ8_9GAMM|nr:response regulator transcription factor [Luteibacter rhizovicinus]TCV93335.1 LuxR family two component transcriptional regulator [Luteibacter rhizovicinus]